jgi:hypothetical protein
MIAFSLHNKISFSGNNLFVFASFAVGYLFGYQYDWGFNLIISILLFGCWAGFLMFFFLKFEEDQSEIPDVVVDRNSLQKIHTISNSSFEASGGNEEGSIMYVLFWPCLLLLILCFGLNFPLAIVLIIAVACL